MFIDAHSIASDSQLETDICIIGAGAAGITIAREFDNTDFRVTVLESGGLNYDEETHSLYHGRNIGTPSFDPHINRLRYFGGTTNHWAGHCRPLDAIDYEKKSWMPHSGWPIKREDVLPYYEQAQTIMELGPQEYDNLDFYTEKTGHPALPLDKNRLKTAIFHQSPPTRFGQVYRAELKASKNVTVFLNANVLELIKTPTGDKIEHVKLACINGPKFTYKAKTFILATGAMENARLLMLSNRANSGGLPINNDLVGRFFMDHLLLRPSGYLSFSRSDVQMHLYIQLQKVASGKMFAVLAASESVLNREKLNNFSLHLYKHRPLATAAGSIFSKIDQNSSQIHVVDADHSTLGINLMMEPSPNPDSRLTLSDQTDLFGQARLDVAWQFTEQDYQSAYRALELAGIEFGRMGLGRTYSRLFTNKKKEGFEAGKHHCGTTRMSSRIETGVVDKACRTHGLSNLYLAGSSIFPTIGYANPTLNIVALALRLAHHLKNTHPQYAL